ncbi:MAG: sigma 54-interacting transcriptional regulator [Lachnospiraceae bacterium]|nr:sigma 54-interacting transcriptional regulator [Lachnospiraceae bacterium]
MNEQNLREQFKTKEEAENRVAYYRQIIESAPDGIYITDGDANAVLINPAFERISGLDRDKLLGRNHRELEKKKIIRESCALKAIDRKEPVTIIHEYLTTGKQALDTCVPVLDEKGEVAFTVSCIRDVTDLYDLRLQLEKEHALRQKYEGLLQQMQEQASEEKLIAHDKKMINTLFLANRVSATDSTVLISGETGAGKEVVANYIHAHSFRKGGPFVAVNCGAIPDSLVESELFGYEEGAFTGAQRGGHKGMIESASGGTLFLDEVGELPLNVQVKLLRVLQERQLVRVGGNKPVPVDIRVISASHRDLVKMVEEGSFRQDLFYRLNVVPITIPPLRERKDDIIPLVNAFLKDIEEKYGLHRTFTQMSFRTLMEYAWPGNIRELQNVVERAAVMCPEEVITSDYLPMYPENIGSSTAAVESGTIKSRVEQYEYALMKEAFSLYPSARKAAKYLGMSEPTFVRKRKEYRKKYGG